MSAQCLVCIVCGSFCLLPDMYSTWHVLSCVRFGVVVSRRPSGRATVGQSERQHQGNRHHHQHTHGGGRQATGLRQLLLLALSGTARQCPRARHTRWVHPTVIPWFFIFPLDTCRYRQQTHCHVMQYDKESWYRDTQIPKQLNLYKWNQILFQRWSTSLCEV